MTIHIAHGPLKFESLWWSLRCTGITVSRATQTGDQYAVVLVGRDKETRMTVAHVVPMKGADMEWVTEQAA